MICQVLQFRIHAASSNAALDDMERVTGFATSGRIDLPPLPKAPVVMHNIRLENSVVASLNTGTVEKIDANITYLDQSGNQQGKDVLKALTELIAHHQALESQLKKDLLDQIQFLSEQAVLGAKDRKPGVIKATLTSLREAAATVTDLSKAWSAAEAWFNGTFGL